MDFGRFIQYIASGTAFTLGVTLIALPSGLLLGFSLGFVYTPCAGPILAAVVTASASQPFGAEKFSWDPVSNTLRRAWVNKTVSCPNGIPGMSAATGLAYCWGARNGWWTFEAIDWQTGASGCSRAAGYELYDNSAYAGMEIGPFGSAATGTLGGANVIAVRR